MDPRRLGTAAVEERFVDELGPEPLGDLSWLPAALAGSRMPVKLWLMDQKKIAGIGNIYAAEILFQAGISPTRPAGSLSRTEVARLEDAIPSVLERGGNRAHGAGPGSNAPSSAGGAPTPAPAARARGLPNERGSVSWSPPCEGTRRAPAVTGRGPAWGRKRRA